MKIFKKRKKTGWGCDEKWYQSQNVLSNVALVLSILAFILSVVTSFLK